MSESNAPTVLITGATSGIGFETARRLLATGSTVLVHGPTPLSTEKAVARLVQAGADPLKIDTAVANFARFGEVAEMAAEISAKYRHIDVLINNAALLGPAGRRLSDDGNELTFQVNYLAHYLLTRALMDRLTVTGKGRVINLSSTLHRTANINWSDPQRTKNYHPIAAYAQSKLALTMFAKSLSTRAPGLTAVSVHPGIVETDLMTIYGRRGQSLTEGAAAVPQLCIMDVSNGSYYERLQVAPPTPLVNNRSAVDRLWKLSAALVDHTLIANEA